MTLRSGGCVAIEAGAPPEAGAGVDRARRAARVLPGGRVTVASPPMARRGVFPGSFDPLTVAHVAVADAARRHHDLAEVHLVVSRVALAKEDQDQAPVEARLSAIEAARASRPWLRAAATEAQLLADIAEGYDVLVVGADKWWQLHDVRFYGTDAAMREALARLPQLAVAPRAGVTEPPGVALLPVDPAHHEVSSTAVRAGRHDWRA